MAQKQKLLEIMELENLAQEVWQILKDTAHGPGPQQEAIIFPGTEDQTSIIGLSRGVDDEDEDDEDPPPGTLN